MAPDRDDAPLRILVTGFGPFPGAPFNPTGALVEALARLRRPGLSGCRIVGHVFRTSYAAVEAELPELIARRRPHVLLMFGLAARTPFLRVETCARNARSGLLSDAAGQLPGERRIVAGGKPRLAGRAPFARLARALQAARLPARLSHNAGRYLCNYLYWRAAEIAPGQAPRLLLFVHVPKLGSGRRPAARIRRRAMTAADLRRAGEVLLRILAAEARKRG